MNDHPVDCQLLIRFGTSKTLLKNKQDVFHKNLMLLIYIKNFVAAKVSPPVQIMNVANYWHFLGEQNISKFLQGKI